MFAFTEMYLQIKYKIKIFLAKNLITQAKGD